MTENKTLSDFVESIKKNSDCLGGYGLKRLRSLAGIFEVMTNGKQQFAGDMEGGVYITRKDSAVTGVQMRRVNDPESGCFRLRFQGYIRRMGVYMSAGPFQEAAKEMRQTAELLEILEQNPILFTEEDMAQWSREITAMQVDQAITQATGCDPRPDLTMGGL